MTLEKIIEQGNSDILNGQGQTPAAMAYMAYHAGISKGQSYTGQRWLDAVKRGLAAAKTETMHRIASRYITAPASGDGDLQGSEAAEILSFDYPLPA